MNFPLTCLHTLSNVRPSPTKPPSRIDGSRGREISLTLLRDLLATGYSCVRKPVRRVLVLGVTTTLVNLTIHYSYRRLESLASLQGSSPGKAAGGGTRLTVRRQAIYIYIYRPPPMRHQSTPRQPLHGVRKPCCIRTRACPIRIQYW